MEAAFKCTQQFVPHLLAFFLKWSKLVILPEKCNFQPFQPVFSTELMFIYVLYSINDCIWANLNCQKIV